MLRAVLHHDIRQLVVHVFLNSFCGFSCLWGLFTNNLGLDWPLRRESLHDAFGLEADDGLGQHGVKHTAGSLPRFCALFVLEAKKLQALDVGLDPVTAVALVFLKIFNQV